MTERRALTCTFIAIPVVLWALLALLAEIGASDEAGALAYLLVLCTAAYVLSRIVMHYAPPDERRR